MIFRSHLGLRSRFLLARAIHHRILPLSSRRTTAMSAVPNVQRVVVRSVPAEDSLTIIVQVAGKQRLLNRPKNEAVEKPLLRLKMSAAPPEKRQKKQAAAAAAYRPGSPPPPVPVALYAGPTEASGQVPGAMSNEEAWKAGRLLRIGESNFLVVMNPPCVDKVLVHGVPLVGFPSLAMPTVQFTEASACSWRWFRSVKVVAAPTSRGSKSEKDIAWQQVEGAEATYVPQEADEGCLLRVECHPPAASPELPGKNGQGGNEVATLDAFVGEPGTLVVGPVGRGPSETAGEYRHPLTAVPLQAPQLRIVTYNLLADQYASSQRGKNKLFTYCPPKYLEPEYRKTLILQELLGFHADVLCLQEVDEKAFTHFLMPHLAAKGYEGAYTNKVGRVAEGCATFWLASRYQAAARLDLSMKKLFKNVSSPGSPHARFLPLLAASPQLVTALQRVGTIAQLVVLIPRVSATTNDTTNCTAAHPSSTVGVSASVEAAGTTADARPEQEGSATGGGEGTGNSEDALCVVNTHLFYHPRAPHIRNIHVAAMLQEASGLIAQTVRELRLSRQPAVLFCGDLNSDLSDGVPGTLELLRRGQLPADFWDWRDGADFSFRGSGTVEEDAHAAAVIEETIAAHTAAVADFAATDSTQSALPSQCEKTVEGGDTDMGNSTSVPSDDEGESPSGGGEQRGIVGLDLTIPFDLRSADGLRTEFTNYVKGYIGALDYVFYEPARLRVLREIPLPSEVEVLSFLPSQRFPSDHLSVVFDLEWVESSAGTGAEAERLPGQFGEDVELPAEKPIRAIPVNAGIAARGLASEGVIVVPTDTLYGLAASAQSSTAMQRIYAIKHRSRDAPLAICVGDAHDVQRYGETDHLPAGLLRRLLPGATTVVLRRRGDAPLSPDLNPGVETIGIRVPQNGFVRDVCREHRGAIALTSANLSGNEGPKDISEFENLWSQCVAVFDGGTIDAGGRAGSTIIDLSEAGYFRILRRGGEQAAVEYAQMLRAEFRLEQRK